MKKTPMLLAFLLSTTAVTAADWSLYGSARVGTWGVATLDKGDRPNTNTDLQSAYYLQKNARFGAKVQDGEVGGLFEAGNKDNVVTLRKLYGTWAINPDLMLLIGQDYSAIDYETSAQAYDNDNAMSKFGAITAGRRPQMKLMGYGVKLSLMDANRPTIEIDADNEYVPGPGNRPKIEVSYDKAIGSMHIGAGAGYNGYVLETEAAPEGFKDEYTVHCFVAAVDFGMKAGSIGINASAGYAQNGLEYGLQTGSKYAVGIDAQGDIVNTATILGYLDLNMAVSDKVTPEIGVGFENHDQDGTKDTRIATYAQVAFAPVPKKVLFVPEVGLMMESTEPDGGSSITEPTYMYFGMKSQINF